MLVYDVNGDPTQGATVAKIKLNNADRSCCHFRILISCVYPPLCAKA